MVLAKALNALAFAQARAGLLNEAERHAQESLAIRVELYGPEHPSLMYPLRALADIARDRKLPEEAIEHLDRGIAIGRRQLGPDAPGLVSSFDERAKDLRALGRYEDALADYEEAERILKVNGRPTGNVLRMQSQVLLRLDRPEQALERAEAALAAHREQLGDDEQQPWLRARFVMHRGEALLALGRNKDALLAFERAAELRAAKQEDGLMLRIWAGAGEAELALGHRERAGEFFDRARDHRVDGYEDNARSDARIDFGLARTADDALTRRRRADMAIAGFEALGDEDRAEQVRAWLESVSSP
jgi:tetratricopeptide (TPR) repeat protein